MSENLSIQPVSVGNTITGADILMVQLGDGPLKILVLGGVHGDESEGFLFLEKYLEELKNGNLRIPEGITLYMIPRVNPDGCSSLRRTNQRNVDLNRNMPTADWNGEFANVRYYPGDHAGSEVESKILVHLITETEPHCIISMHSYENAMVNFNGDCENWAVAMSEKNELPPKGDIGYPTPGSLGTYAGWERNIPTITLEIFRTQEPEAVWAQHLEGFQAGLDFYTKHPLPERKYV
jgi:murein peptide amidase A